MILLRILQWDSSPLNHHLGNIFLMFSQPKQIQVREKVRVPFRRVFVIFFSDLQRFSVIPIFKRAVSRKSRRNSAGIECPFPQKSCCKKQMTKMVHEFFPMIRFRCLLMFLPKKVQRMIDYFKSWVKMFHVAFCFKISISWVSYPAGNESISPPRKGTNLSR